jgi:hypothetical protein
MDGGLERRSKLAPGKTRLSAHEKWMRDDNLQQHMAHEKREDGCHSPASVLGWVKGMQPKTDLVYHAIEAICETRILTKAGYARFRNFLLYGEPGLAGKRPLSLSSRTTSRWSMTIVPCLGTR